MYRRESYDDIAFLLFVVPFIGTAVYAVVLWARTGASAILPESVYLTVTKDPYLFLLGFVSVLFACVIEITNEEPAQRSARLLSLSRRLQTIAIISLVLAFLAAWYANGFNLGGGVVDLLEGRFAVVFPGLLMLFSFLILPSIRLQRNQRWTIAAVIALLAVPAVVYEVGKREYAAGLGLGLILIAVGVTFSLLRSPESSS